MVHYLIMCRSLTYAQRAAKALERVGISAIVTKAPQSITSEGCAYCVKVSERRLAESLATLKNEGLGPGKVYMRAPDGKVSEVER